MNTRRVVPPDFPVGMLTLPKAAADLVDAAERAGWAVLIQFCNVESAGGPFFTIQTGPTATGRRYDVTWHSRATGGKSYRLFGKIMREQAGGRWRDAPSVASVKQYITNNPVEGGQQA